MIKQVLTLVAVFLLATSISAHAMLFTLDPSGSVSGAPGSTVGWGFTVFNNSTDWVQLIGSDFNTPDTIGTYTDFIILNSLSPGYLLAPNTGFSEVFNLGSTTGTGSFTFDSSFAVYGLTTNGTIDLMYDTFSDIPDGFNQTGFGDIITAAADATPTPEPGTMLLLGAGIIGLLRFRRRFQPKPA